VHASLCQGLGSWAWQFLNTDISQGSVVTQLRCGGLVNDDFVANLVMNLPVKEFFKSVNIWRSYWQYYSGLHKLLLLEHNQHFFTLTFRSLSETFIRRSLFSSCSGSCHDSDARRGKKSVVRVAQRVAALVPVQGLPSFSNMHCLFDPSSAFVDSLSKIAEAGQLITYLSWDAWWVSADLFCSDRLDARWFLVKGLLVMDSTSVLCSFNLVLKFLPRLKEHFLWNLARR